MFLFYKTHRYLAILYRPCYTEMVLSYGYCCSQNKAPDLSEVLRIFIQLRIRIWGFGETEWYKKVMRHGVFLNEKLVVLA